MIRELSLEERINLTSIIRGPTLKQNGAKRYTFEMVTQGDRYADLAKAHFTLDQWYIPRFTECPYWLSGVELHLATGQRLDVARVNEDGALTISTEQMQRQLFADALDGRLTRHEPSDECHRMVYLLNQKVGDDRIATECEKGDLLIRVPQDSRIYALTICPKARAKANAMSKGSV